MKIKRFSTAANNLQEFLKTNEINAGVFEENVRNIAHEVKTRGDEAILEYTLKYDGARLDQKTLLVTDNEIEEAYELVDDEFLFALRKAIDNIMIYHSRQNRNSWMEADEAGNTMGQIYRPVKRAGIYVPGGTAAYPSSVLMNAIPAQVAGVEQIAMVTPPGRNGKLNPYTLVAAAELGLEEIYKMGGAQAVFALAWGTQSVPKVDIITGPGNIYVTLAKKMVYGDVNIDMLAGPSEILIVADDKANPVHIAADMMSQAEHDVLARSILVTNSDSLINEVEKELARQVEKLERRDIIKKALNDHGAFILADDINEACQVANLVAPEHLELVVEHPFEMLHQIQNAGAIFLGANTPEPVGDYYAGPNHILPTGGTARFYSPVTVDTFKKVSNIIYYSAQGIKENCDDIIRLAEVEGLTAHANSLKVRKEE
ncbi:MAG TPA: histidinol dehydrogenase [Syntrophomonadaceae bacterium]|nr:histidinol dehydrogenase [Syntrophomonadaceae bacterium]